MKETAERLPQLREPKNFGTLLSEVPDAVSFAKLETETSEMAKSPEGKYVLTYLFAARNLLRPVLTEAHIHRDLMMQTGGYDYNPSRNIDDVGTAIALTIAKDAYDLPNFWIHTEESGVWMPAHTDNGFREDASRFAVIDSLDMTSSIALGDRVQTTGVGMYDKEGNLLSVGIMSLVDDKYIFIDKRPDGGFNVHSHNGTHTDTDETAERQLKYAAKTRRMYTLNDTQLVTRKHARVLDCDSGYAVLALHHGDVDTVVDHVKGNPWYEVVIWIRAAQAMGYPVTDAEGRPIDMSAVMKRAINVTEGDAFRVPYVVSRTPEIHQRVLDLLKK